MKYFILVVAALTLLSCASTYKPIRPDATYYSNSSRNKNVDFSYKMGVLREMGNKKYAKREDSKGIRLTAVKIKNNTDRPLTVGTDLHFVSGNLDLILIEPGVLHKQLKQGVAGYLLYLLLTPLKFYKSEPDPNGGVETETTRIGYVIGPGLAIGNMAVAGGANQHFLNELSKFNLINKTINPGETAFGIIGVQGMGYNEISIRINNFGSEISGE